MIIRDRILEILEEYPDLFSKIVDRGICKLDDSGELKYIDINICPDFFELILPNTWLELIEEEQKFFIIHSLLHIIYEHHKRSIIDIKFQMACDMVINDILIDKFRFSVDIIFRHNLISYELLKKLYPNVNILRGQNVEYYFKFFNNNTKLLTVDNSKFIDDANSMQRNNKKYNISNTDNSLKDIQDNINEFLDNGYDRGLIKSPNEISYIKFMKTEHPNWRHFFNKALKQTIRKELIKIDEHWDNRNRRYELLDNTFFLPSDKLLTELDFAVNIWIFHDISDSCINQLDYYFNLIKTINIPNNVKMEYFYFNTKVIKANNKIPIGGGTDFNCIKRYIKTNSRHTIYPWIITDGKGGYIDIDNPKEWFWFLIGDKTTEEYLPKNTNICKYNGRCS